MNNTKEFHKKTIKCLLSLNDQESEDKKIDPDELLNALEDDSFYEAYHAYLKKYKLKNNDKELKSFCKLFLKALNEKNFLKSASYENILNSQPNPDIVVKEHENVHPVSYMAFSNLETILHDSNELLEILNHQDDLPQWVDELLSISKNNVNKALNYVRSEKTNAEPSEEDKKKDQLTSEAQYRGFLSSVKNVFNRPKTLAENALVETDEKLRDIFLNHGALKTSLNHDIKLAKQAVESRNFAKAKRHLSDFNNALIEMSEAAEEYLEIPESEFEESLEKSAGFFDMFKSKKEEPAFTVGSKITLKNINSLISFAEDTLNTVKSIFKMLDQYRGSMNTKLYYSMLQSLQNEQKIFSKRYASFQDQYFLHSEEPIERNLQEMTSELLKPKKNFQIEECPCGSTKPWMTCHGLDLDRIKKIMKDKNVSYEEAEIKYLSWWRAWSARQAEIIAEREEAEREEAERQKVAQERKIKYNKYLT